MLKQTDERYVPWSDDLCTGYEHIHRYLLCQRYVSGKRVLDLACGEGYGSWYLSQIASEVVGIDICKESIQHASHQYQKSNLSFRIGSILNVPINKSECFDVIVCFEALEHISEHAELLCHVKSLLTQNGMFIVSTPNKPVYSENGTRQNPYHLKELDFNEFDMLLGQHFKQRQFYGQKTYASSKIFPIHAATDCISEFRINKGSHHFEFAHAEDQYPRYYIAIASDAMLGDNEMKSYLTDVTPRYGYIKWEHTQCESSLPQAAPQLSSSSRRYMLAYISSIASITLRGLVKFLQKFRLYLGQTF